MIAFEFAVGLIVLVLALLMSIALHELGHLISAKHYGVSVHKYMVGFGPTLWSRQFRGTEYGLKALPLGGFITMQGMYPDLPGDESEYKGLPFFRLRTYQKIAIMINGPLVNLALAFVFLLIAFWGFGGPAIAIGAISECTPRSTSASCSPGDKVAPAAQQLDAGDVIFTFDGKPANQWADIVKIIHDAPDEDIKVTVLRSGEELDRTVRLGRVEGTNGKEIGFLGVTPTSVLIPQSLTAAIGQMTSTITTSVNALVKLPVSAVETAGSFFSATGPTSDRPVSLVGAGHAAGAIASATSSSDPVKIQSMLALIGQLNFALFFINLLPLPPFDGGHIAVSAVQGIRDRITMRRGRERPVPINAERLVPIMLVVFVIFAAMSLVFITADIVFPIF